MRAIMLILFLSTLTVAAFCEHLLADELKQKILQLERSLSLEPYRLDLRFELSMLEEQAGDLEAARNAVGEIVRIAPDHFDSVIRYAGLSLDLRDYAEAEKAYRTAAALNESSLEAILGLQSALIGGGKWNEAEIAGRTAIEKDNENYDALSRQGYVLFMLEKYAEALSLYERALAQSPDDAEVLLGIGFTQMRLGNSDAGRTACLRAKVRLSESDPRVDACLSPKKSRGVYVGAEGRFSYLRYVAPDKVEDIKYTTLTAWGAFDFGLLLWSGAGLTHSTLPWEAANYYHIPVILGLAFRKPAWRIEGSGGMLLSNSGFSDKTGLLHVGFELMPDKIGFSISSDLCLYTRFAVVQAVASLLLHPTARVEVEAGPDIIVISDESEAVTAGKEGVGTYVSGHLGVTGKVHKMFSLFAAGFAGPRMRMVEASGLSVWTNDDGFMGGYVLGFKVTQIPHFNLDGAFVHYIGTFRRGRFDSFQVLGFSVGISYDF